MSSPTARRTPTRSEKVTLQAGGILAFGACCIFLSPLLFPTKSEKGGGGARRHEVLMRSVSGPDDPGLVQAAIQTVGWQTADVDFGISRKSLLLTAAEKGNRKIVAYLLDNRYLSNPVEITQAFLISISQDDPALLHYFVKGEVISKDMVSQGLWTAALSGRYDAAVYLLDNGADVSVPPGNPLLVRAAGAGDTRIIKLLLDRGAKVNEAVNVRGFPARKEFAAEPRPHPGVAVPPDEASRVLFRQQVDSSANGITALMTAAIYGRNPEVVRLLLSRGADPAIKSTGGLTALDFARHYGHTEIVRLLESARKP